MSEFLHNEGKKFGAQQAIHKIQDKQAESIIKCLFNLCLELEERIEALEKKPTPEDKRRWLSKEVITTVLLSELVFPTGVIKEVVEMMWNSDELLENIQIQQQGKQKK